VEVKGRKGKEKGESKGQLQGFLSVYVYFFLIIASMPLSGSISLLDKRRTEEREG